MNVSMLVASFNYLCTFESVVSLATWIYKELVTMNYADYKLIRSFDYEHLDIAESIIHLNRNQDIINGLYIGIIETEYQKAKLLLEAGADINLNRYFTLQNASRLGYIDVVRLLRCLEGYQKLPSKSRSNLTCSIWGTQRSPYLVYFSYF